MHAILQFSRSRTEKTSEDTKDLLKFFSNDWCQAIFYFNNDSYLPSHLSTHMLPEKALDPLLSTSFFNFYKTITLQRVLSQKLCFA